MEIEPSPPAPSVEVLSRSFVNFSSMNDMASASTRTAIASHAARLRRQHRRKQASLSAGEVVHDFLVWKRDQAQDPEDQIDGADQQPQEYQRQRTVAVRLNPVPLRRVQPRPYNILGQGRKDPFATFAVFDPPDIVHEVIDHAVHHFWPGFTPGSMPNSENPVVTRYLEAIRQTPLAFYAYMIGTAENYELLSGIAMVNKAFSQLCLSYRVEMMKLINLELQSLTGPPSDNLLGAIVVLAGNHVLFAGGQTRVVSLESVNASRFRSPLRTAQFIHIYSSRPFVSPHSAALLRLTAMKGGCSKIALPGVASTIELCDLVYASQTDSQLHLLSMDPPNLMSLENLRVSTFSSSLIVWTQLPISADQQSQLVQVVEGLSLVTNALEWHIRGSPPSVEYSGLVSARNAAQFLLLSLLPAAQDEQKLSPGGLPEYMFEIARLSLRIFSNLVLFPMNPTGGTANLLSLALKAAILGCTTAVTGLELSAACKKILLWSLVLGGMQADDDRESKQQLRTWFLSQYIELSSQVNLVSWELLRECLVSILWSESVLNLAAWEFWNDSLGGTFIHQDS
ncbi:hypothetical protein LTR84_005307 [Exophiala bonariae]|uniref:Transcription factor domain-containing protein n=1 Tax=Exophiala bonariae TaxID=1690606 RepID=A0AAV9N6U2_9EURO|nr:hypothetical protein LTR84_005307 [Exophiala bonariae]